MYLNPTKTLYARYIYSDHGYESQQKQAELYLELGAYYKLEGVSMGQSSTSIKLDGIAMPFNSVQFEFYDRFMEKHDIYSDNELNPYIGFGK